MAKHVAQQLSGVSQNYAEDHPQVTHVAGRNSNVEYEVRAAVEELSKNRAFIVKLEALVQTITVCFKCQPLFGTRHRRFFGRMEGTKILSKKRRKKAGKGVLGLLASSSLIAYYSFPVSPFFFLIFLLPV